MRISKFYRLGTVGEAANFYDAILNPPLYQMGSAEREYFNQVRAGFNPPESYNFIQPKFRSFLN